MCELYFKVIVKKDHSECDPQPHYSQRPSFFSFFLLYGALELTQDVRKQV